MECNACRKPVLDKCLGYWSSWQKLAHLFEFLEDQELISEATYESALQALLDLKGIVMDAEDKRNALLEKGETV